MKHSVPMTALQKKTAQAIVNIFETGRVLGDYGAVAVIAGDTGHLSYGRSQATLSGGGLYTLLKDYCAGAGAQMAEQFRPLLPRFEAKDLTLDTDDRVQALLREAGDDPAMRDAQDRFFDKSYWEPACAAAAKLSLTTALSTAVVYDGHVHGSFGLIRDRVNKAAPMAAGTPEKSWIAAYVAARKEWLLGAKGKLPDTVYRMDEFNRLIAEEKWELPLPIVVRGVSIDERSLDPATPAVRTLRLARPPLRGDDVRALQMALNQAGFANAPDGVFGPATDALLKRFQSGRGLAADGVAGARTRSALKPVP
jgi:chitosanase